MSETLTWTAVWLAGALLGAIFYGGLWWTVRRGVSSARPALWFLGSFVLRTGLALGGFYGVAGGHWERMLLCLLGFVMARPLVNRWTRAAEQNAARAPEEARHAP